MVVGRFFASLHSLAVEAPVGFQPSRFRMSLSAWRFLISDQATSIGMGLSMLHASSSSGFRHGLSTLIDRILDEAHQKGVPLALRIFFYGQDFGFRDF
jgi:hypothetical protein